MTFLPRGLREEHFEVLTAADGAGALRTIDDQIDAVVLDVVDALDHAGHLTISQAIYREWLRLFIRLTPEFRAG